MLITLVIIAASHAVDDDLAWRNAVDDLAWRNNPKQWHQQLARIVDHRFLNFQTLEKFAIDAKKAGVGALMLVQIQKSAACPGPWYNGLQLCDHINGSNPAADGTLAQWQKLVSDLKPMRLMWWTNPTYWSVQGEVWAQAKRQKFSEVGRFFSWNVTDADRCYGANPDGGDGVKAQGSWGSIGIGQGVDSALASFGSPSYADYLVDAMANSWTRNLGIDGYTIDCSANYGPTGKGCPNGMLHCGGDSQGAWAKIVARVKALQPQVVLSGEGFGSWAEVIHSGSDIGGQGFGEYHTRMQRAVVEGDASGLEDVASTSGADAATILCYLHANYDGEQPGACPTMYFRDATAALPDVRQHEMWVALEAASGIVPQHDYDPNSVCRVGPGAFNGCSADKGAWWNVTNDPRGGGESPLWAFAKHRALNRLAFRTKLNLTQQQGVAGSGGDGGGGGALAYLKHDSMGPYGDAALVIFNPGRAQTLSIDLSLLPPALVGGTIVPYDLFTATNRSSSRVMTPAPPPLTANWTVTMGAGEMRAFGGFHLGVFAPRKGKKAHCVPDDGYTRKLAPSTLQECFLECARDGKCEHVLVEYIDIKWMEAPPPATCTLLGAVADPAAACKKGTGTLVKRLGEARSCAHLWHEASDRATGGAEATPLAFGAEAVPPGLPLPRCPRA